MAEQRDRWITTVCAGLLEGLDGHPALDAVEIAPELGDYGLERAVLVTRIAALVAGGCSTGDIAERLMTSQVFVAPGPDLGQLTDLVEKVHRQLGLDGIACSVWLLGCGLRAWSPESTYRLLLEFWSARRLGSVSSTQVRRELKRKWNVQDPRQREACLTRPQDPLKGYPDVWATLKAEPDARVGNVAALGLNSKPSQQTGERWADRLPFNAARAEHLLTVGGDLVYATQALQFLRRLRDQLDLDLRRATDRAMAIIESQLDRVSEAINGLTTLERELLSERTDEEYFQDGCLTAALNWSCTAEARPWTDGSDTAHGMWGPLPWWTIAVRDDDQERAAAALLTGARPIGLERDPAQPDQVELICRRPLTEEAPGLRAHFTFDLTNPAHASELLVIGRRGDIRVDVLRKADDSQDTPQPVVLGTLHVTTGPELAQLLTGIASAALKKLLPAEHGPDDSDLGNAALDAALRSVSGYHLDPWSSARKLLVTEYSGTTGAITLEDTDPPTTMIRVAKAERPTKRSPVRTAQQTVPLPHECGFVYVQRNPGIPGMVKIGYTDRLPEERANELSCTPVPFSFEVLYRAMSTRAHEVEQAVHRLLAAHRVNPKREFFRVTQETAEQAIRYCQELVTGIGSWEPMPVLHPLRAGDRITLPLKANQLFVTTAYPHWWAPSATIVDIWQAHEDGDLLELYVTADPGRVRGQSDGDPGADEDPAPYLNRDGTAPNGLLIGRERLVAGDRLSWLSDQDGASTCDHVVFEVRDFCQVICRTWNPQSDSDGVPLQLSHVTRTTSAAINTAVHEVLALRPPRTWAPRHPSPVDDWVPPATRPTPPEHWLAQLQRGRDGR